MLITIRNIVVYTILSILICSGSNAQTLKPGFDADEYIGVLQRSSLHVDKQFQGNLPKEMNFDRIYISPKMGLHNKWDLWLSKDKTTIAINLRGTTSDVDNWLENFYTAMIPATGSLALDGKTQFNYKFANDPKAMVHVGWSVGICSLIPDIMEKINLWYGKGVKQIIIEGHSQGGALAFLLSAYVYYQVADGKLPKDLVVKTYCSAPPKPGNLYFAYDFDFCHRGGWAQAVVNEADWVPEMPFSVQTVSDIIMNPFALTNKTMSKNLIVRWYTKHIYKSLDRHTRSAQKKFEKFLGKVIYKQVKKYMKEFRQPEYGGSCNYARAGNPVVLEPDAAYYERFPDTGSNIFRNHLFEPYYYLVNKQYK